MKRYICAAVCLLWGAIIDLYAQDADSLGVDQEVETKYYISVMARSYGDSVAFRWGVSDPGVWMLSNKYGWRITSDRSDCDSCSQVSYVGGDTIKAMLLDQMMRSFSPDHQLAGVAAQALYGKSFFPVEKQEGQSLTNFVFRRHQEQTQRQFAAYFAAERDARVAEALGLRITDRNVKRGHTYEYLIESLIPDSIVKVVSTRLVVRCEPYERDIEELIPEINIKQLDAFTALVYVKKNKLSGYYFERSEDGGKTWKKLNDGPVYPQEPTVENRKVFGDSIADLMATNVIFRDSLKNDKKYIYRVSAFDAFADFAPAVTSKEFKMLDLIPPFAPYLEVIETKENRVCTINWVKDVVEPDLKTFAVTFAPTPEGPWQKVSGPLGKDVRQYVDNNARERGRGYYRVFCSDTSGNVAYSNVSLNFIEDVTPPAAPTGLAAEVDSTGIMTLFWHRNTETDLRGYKVYAANQMDHEFVEISNGYLNSNIFVDTLDINMLTKHYFCYVVAFDNRHNFSSPSDTLEVKFPDFLPPGIVLLEDYKLDNGELTVKWRKSVSDDVVNYFIYRKPKNQTRWEALLVVSPDDVNEEGLIVMKDYPEPSSVPYQYCAEAIDESRNSSGKTGVFTVMVSGPDIVDVPITLTAEKVKKSSNIVLKWDYEYKSRYDHYGVIFRSVNGSKFVDIANFERGEKTFVDKSVKEGSNVRYYIQLFLGAGKKSKPSSQVSVKVGK